MHSVKRTPGRNAHAHFTHTHAHTHRHGKHTFAHLHKRTHGSWVLKRKKRLHHLVVWHETMVMCLYEVTSDGTVCSYSYRIHEHYWAAALKSMSLRVGTSFVKMKTYRQIANVCFCHITANCFIHDFAFKMCVSHCKLKYDSWHNSCYVPKKLMEIIFFFLG